jgi:uncharacterized membrane protein YfcA
MNAGWTTLQVAAVLLLASFVRSAFGFGEALIAVPLLAFVIPVEVAAPLAVLASITVALIVVLQDWNQIHARSAAWLVLSTLFGIPLGLALLKAAPEPAVKAILAVVIIGFSTYSLRTGGHNELKNDRFAWLFGFSAGVLGGAYGMNGPPLVIYGSLRRWTPGRFRATLQGYFLPASLMGMGGYFLAGLWTSAVNHLYLVSLPGIVLASLLGRIINRRMNAQSFLIYIHVGLVLIGAVLLVQALWRHARAG